MSSRSTGTLRLLLRPSMFLLHVPAAAALVTAVLLGNWQVDSWEASREDRSAELIRSEPKPLAEVMGPDDPFTVVPGQPVAVPGTWDPDGTVYVEDKEYDGSDGYWAVTPLLTCGSTADACAEPAGLPVVVGWIPSVAEAPSPPEGSAEITGWLQPGEGAGAADTDPADDVLSSLRIAELLQRSQQDLYGAFLILDEPAQARSGVEPLTPENLPEAPTFTALRNLLYGIEWYFFAGFAAFLWWRWSKDEIARARRPEDEGVTPVSADAEEAEEVPEARLPSHP